MARTSVSRPGQRGSDGPDGVIKMCCILSLKICVPFTSTNTRKKTFFSVRVIELWNDLTHIGLYRLY